jgi:ABC-type bacteriocin/lantibiotic exporter with double-glycine peptidase domain
LLASIDVVALIASSFGVSGILLLYIFLFRNRLIELGKKRDEAESAVIQTSTDVLRGYREINIYGKREIFVGALASVMSMVARVAVHISVHSLLPRQLLELAVLAMFFSAAALTNFGLLERELFLSMSITYAVVLLRVIPLASSLAGIAIRMKNLKNSLMRLEKTILRGEKISQNAISKKLRAPAIKDFISLKMESVTYKYANAESAVINNVSLELKPGDVLGVIGQSGEGKTTLLNLISGLLVPTIGKVEINSQNVTNIMPENCGIAYVPQETVLVSGSVLDNITLIGNPDHSTIQNARNACDIACLTEMMSEWQDGLNTQIGDAGFQISGGQRQRVALARATFHKRPLILLDEATNALDEDLEKKVINNLKKANPNSAFVIVTHRKSTLSYCTKIVELRSGRLVKC